MFSVLQKLQSLNEYMAASGNGIKLRRKLFEFFPLPLITREAHVDSQLLAAGCSMKIVTDVVPAMNRLLNDKDVSFYASVGSSSSVIGSAAMAASSSSVSAVAALNDSQNTNSNVMATGTTTSSSSSSGGGALHPSQSFNGSSSTNNFNNDSNSGAYGKPKPPLGSAWVKVADDERQLRLKVGTAHNATPFAYLVFSAGFSWSSTTDPSASQYWHQTVCR